MVAVSGVWWLFVVVGDGLVVDCGGLGQWRTDGVNGDCVG
jgi:hypothetical protein